MDLSGMTMSNGVAVRNTVAASGAASTGAAKVAVGTEPIGAAATGRRRADRIVAERDCQCSPGCAAEGLQQGEAAAGRAVMAGRQPKDR